MKPEFMLITFTDSIKALTRAALDFGSASGAANLLVREFVGISFLMGRNVPGGDPGSERAVKASRCGGQEQKEMESSQRGP